MKRKILTILALLLGLAGLGVLLYPSVSNWIEQAKQRRLRDFSAADSNVLLSIV